MNQEIEVYEIIEWIGVGDFSNFPILEIWALGTNFCFWWITKWVLVIHLWKFYKIFNIFDYILN
jgi:hypothetical protein